MLRFLIRGCLGSDLSFTFCGENGGKKIGFRPTLTYKLSMSMAEITTFARMQAWYRSYEPIKRGLAISNTDFSSKWKYILGPKITTLREQGLSPILKTWNTRPQQVPIKFIPAFKVPSEVSIQGAASLIHRFEFSHVGSLW